MKNRIRTLSVAATIVLSTALSANASVVSALDFPTFPAGWEGKVEKRYTTQKLKDRFTTFSIKKATTDKIKPSKR